MYVKVKNGKATEYQLNFLKVEYPNTSFPKVLTDELLARFDIFPVHVQPDPSYDPLTQRVVKNEPTYNNGKWNITKRVEMIHNTELELKIKKSESAIRHQRDQLLSACDWTQMPDVQLTDKQKAAWVVYRQELRDITTKMVNGTVQEWPTPPK